jgi:hypothetical protein
LNDIDLVRDLRAEIPSPDPTRLAAGRARLVDAAGAVRPAAARPFVRRRSFVLPATAVAASVAVAAGFAGYGLSTRSAPAKPAAAPNTPAAHAPAKAELAARILRQASTVVERAPVRTVPAPGQWIYTRTIDVQYKQATTSGDNWETFDGSETAYYWEGQLIVHQSGQPGGAIKGNPLTAFEDDATPRTAYYALASLPSDPAGLLAVIGRAASGAGDEEAGNPLIGSEPKTKAQREFGYLTSILWNAAAGVGGPPKAEAAAFRAMATLPGITVQPGVKDAAGADAIAVSDNGGLNQLLLDPGTYQVLGLRQLSDGMDGALSLGKLPSGLRDQFYKLKTAQEKDAWLAAHQALIKKLERQFSPPAGTVLESLAYARVSEVAAPGTR